MNSTLAYTTESGQTHGVKVGPQFIGMPMRVDIRFDEFCFICGRVTDHFAEHDDREDVVYDHGVREEVGYSYFWSYVR